MSKTIDEEKLRAARAKLACHIEPPKNSPYAKMLAEQGAVNGGGTDSFPSLSDVSKSDDSSGSSCSPGAEPVVKEKIRLTEMTTAGG